MSKAQRNAQCACGSGKKYKHCHGKPGRPAPPWNRALTMTVVALGAGICLTGVWAVATADKTATDGRVWSAEHGHWHDANGRELGASLPVPGAAPVDGAVWSAEHGHWHDANGQEIPAAASSSGPPPGPAPAGKVWSPEHNHWH